MRIYFQKVGEQQDIATGMAVGFTINHVVAVLLHPLDNPVTLP